MQSSKPNNQNISVKKNLPMETRDGTLLRSDVYKPSLHGSWPVLLQRTPYDKASKSNVKTARDLASRGYIVVVQDIRGRYASDGEFIWQFRDNTDTFDANDGYDTVEWASNFPGSDGQVGTWGHSYPSWCIWQLASTRPPHLKAVFASGMASNILDLTFGIFETGRRLQWTYNMSVDAKEKAGHRWGPSTRAEADLQWHEVERGKWIWQLPLDSIPDYVFSTLTPQLKKYMREQNQEFWSFDKIHNEVNVPTCQVTGWYDRLIGTIDNYSGMVNNGPSVLSKQHRIVVGPWGHDSGAFIGQQGPVDFGPEANTTYEDQVARWYDYRFKNIDNGIGTEPPVKLFIMGENKWRYEESWPPSNAKPIEFFLHSKGSANSVFGNGSLLRSEPSKEPPDEYDYDPRDPVMSLMDLSAQAAVREQSPLDLRNDILVYVTPPLEHPVTVIGPVVLKLWASSSAVDTDFTAKLIDVHPDGSAINLSYGIMRTMYRYDYKNPQLMNPNTPYEFTIKLGATGIRFGQGHQIRLDIASSDFPNFDRNHNTGADFWSDTELRIAHQTVFHDMEHPSRLILMLID